MKLHLLKITGMGPFAGTETVDFNRLDQAGVYLLTGRTGSGKTTVLDAVSYAIFGKIPRNANGADIASHHRRPETAPQVVLDVTIGGLRQRITRTPKHKGPAARGTGIVERDQTLLVEDRAGDEWVQKAGGWREGNDLLEGRIGMTAEQFNQVVMLPQGQFEKFLDASANERRELLQRLFPGTDLAWLEQWLRDEADTAAERRDAKLGEIGDRFQRVRPIVRKLQPEPEAGQTAEPGEDPDLLPEHGEAGPALTWIERTGRRLEEIARRRETARAEAHQAWDDAATELRRLEKLAELIRKRRTADRKLAGLEERLEWRSETGRKVELARQAAPVKPLADTADRRRQELAEVEADRDRIRPLIEGSRFTAGIPAEELTKRRERLHDQARQIHDFIWGELSKRDELSAEIEELEQRIAALDDHDPESRLGRAMAAVTAGTEAAAEALRRYLEIREARTRGMARELAGELEDGVPCPVCGSTDHPHPAEGADEVPSEREEKQAENARTRARDAQAEAEKALAETRSEVAAGKAAAESALAAARDSLERLSARERELRGEAAEIEDRHEELTTAVGLLDDLIQTDLKLKTAESAAERAGREAADEATARGFDSLEPALAAVLPPAELESLASELELFDRELSIVRAELAGELADINPEEKVETGPAVAAEKETAEARDRATKAAGSAGDDLDTFRSETGGVPGLYTDLAPLRDTADRTAELNRLASGRNERRMRLSIFFLASRLRQVIEAANGHLAQMTDQRYALIYSDDARDGRSQSGLEIDVYDSHTSASRSTGTLSGGEKFCAALSLALGLAEVVQVEADGKSLETLFIDEGFGTLDSRSLEQVMTVIDSLREGGRSVGLVSHVEELRDRVPAQIRVSGDSHGSTLEVVA